MESPGLEGSDCGFRHAIGPVLRVLGEVGLVRRGIDNATLKRPTPVGIAQDPRAAAFRPVTAGRSAVCARRDEIASRLPYQSLRRGRYLIRTAGQPVCVTICANGARGLRYHLRPRVVHTASRAVRRRGSAQAPLLLMLHGWMDVSASYQFVVDHLEASLGGSSRPTGAGSARAAPGGADSYWFPGLPRRSRRDLRRVVARRAGAPGGPFDGGQRRDDLCRRARESGARPGESRRIRIARGRRRTQRGRAFRASGWTNSSGPMRFTTYADREAVADRLVKTNPRLARDKALFLARALGDVPAGRPRRPATRRWADAAHKRTNPGALPARGSAGVLAGDRPPRCSG